MTDALEDSEDLTDADVAAAVVVLTPDAMIKHLVKCSCGELYEKSRYELRRRAPHMFIRARMECSYEHASVLVFRADWLTLA